jgi:hypothetical protein
MRILFSLAAIVALSGCLPRATEPLRAVPVVEPRPSLPLRAPTNPEPPSAPHDDPPHSPPQEATVRRATRSGIGLTGVSFDSRLNRLVVADQPAGPNSKWRDGAAAAKAVGGIAAINGGFFTPEGEPLGLAIASGAASGTWNRASALGSGIWHDGRISRREAIGQTAARSGRELLQSGPMLVENGTPVSKLNAGKLAVRSVILWDHALHPVGLGCRLGGARSRRLDGGLRPESRWWAIIGSVDFSRRPRRPPSPPPELESSGKEFSRPPAEMKRILDSHRSGDTLRIPIFVRPCLRYSNVSLSWCSLRLRAA